ncbi:MAG: phosphoethanolamine transferase domain-containing protein, partial [Rickettsiales bacterium]|nr:phosphoethanolamine transferase domain-containing protein [Rickettsiales bacterium]
MFCIHLLTFNILLHKFTLKPIAIVLLLFSSATNYFMLKYNVYIDKDMIRNTFETNIGETLDLITITLVLYVIITGIIPCFFLFKTKIQYGNYKKRLLNVGYTLTALIVVFLASYKQYAFFGRNHSKVNRLINTGNYIQGTHKYFKNKMLAKREFMFLDQEATKTGEPQLIVMVIGETSRAKNWSLNGYKNGGGGGLT